MASSGKTQVYYDGSCPFCRRAMRHYCALDKEDALEPVDIAAPGFQPPDLRLSMERMWKEIHVLTPDGGIHRGIDGIIAIWQQIPGRRWLATWGQLPGIHWILAQGYRFVSTHRHWLA